MKTAVRAMLLAGSVAVAALGTGCQGTAKADRDALAQQNRDYKAQIDALNAQLSDLKAQQAAAASQPVAVAPAAPEMPAAPAPAPAENTTAVQSELGSEATIGKNKQGQTTITIGSDVLFEPGKADLKPAAKRTLDKVAGLIKKQYATSPLDVQGYTDSQPIGKSGWDDNWDLGAARARSVALYLISKGVPKKNIRITSFADNEPKSTTKLAANRRVEVVVLK